MPVPTATYIYQMDPTAPDGDEDQIFDGDDEIKNIKFAVKNTFPNLTTAVNATTAEVNMLVGFTGSAIPQTWSYFKSAARYEVGTTVGSVLVIQNVNGLPGLPQLDGSNLVNVSTTQTAVPDINILNTRYSKVTQFFLGQL